MLSDIIVIDNIFDNPDEVRSLALQQKYYNTDDHPEYTDTKVYWRGERTKKIDNLSKELYDKIFAEIFSKIKRNIFPYSNPNSYNIKFECKSYFHKFPSLGNIFNDDWFHIDVNELYAGVIYLNPEPEQNSGTWFVDNGAAHPVDNVYNRLVLYKGERYHAPMKAFGEGNNSRLTLTMFFSMLKFESVK